MGQQIHSGGLAELELPLPAVKYESVRSAAVAVVAMAVRAELLLDRKELRLYYGSYFDGFGVFCRFLLRRIPR